MYHAPLSMLLDTFGLLVYAQDEENETLDSALAMTTGIPHRHITAAKISHRLGLHCWLYEDRTWTTHWS